MTTTIGILGGGQLGCMLHAAACDLGLRPIIADPDPDCPGAALPGAILVEDWRAAAAHLGEVAITVTWEREDLPLDALAAAGPALRPSVAGLARIQDRGEQKALLDELGLPTAAWRPADRVEDADTIARELGLPLMVKARRGGFDGRGQRVARDRAQLVAAIGTFAPVGAIAERLIPFDDEFAALVTRGADGRVVHYPLVWTRQHRGQLSWAIAPHPRAAALAAWAQDTAAAIAERLDHVGTLAVECFRRGDAAVVNELAPRVHNSGHWTIEGCAASQFENHLRAICDLPLIEPKVLGSCLMVNCIGTMPPPERCRGWARHDYRKQARPGRKVGHLTLRADDLGELLRRARRLDGVLLGEPPSITAA